MTSPFSFLPLYYSMHGGALILSSFNGEVEEQIRREEPTNEVACDMTFISFINKILGYVCEILLLVIIL